MANFFKKMLGIVHVQQKGDTIQIGGMATQTLYRDIETTWGTSKINKFMFTNFGTRFIEFDLFFALEVHYMLQTLLKNKRNWTSKSAIQSAIKQLEENTWLAQITAQQPVGEKLDRSKLSMFHKTPLPHQTEFFNQYEIGTSRLGLNGFLLAAGAGSGKTLMDLMVAEMVHSDYIIVISPKNAIDRVWVETLTKEYKKPQEYWMPASGLPYKGQRVLLAHYEALEKLIPEAKRLSGKVTVVLDESHNFNEVNSQRTNLFLDLCKVTKSENIIWASGTPIKALGGESIPLLRSIDPLFTPQVEERFKKIFGINAKRALDILRNRMGFINYRVEKSTVVDNKPTEIRIDVKIPNGREYTLDAMREKMTKYIAERTEYYKKNYKQYEDVYERCLKIFESQMSAMDKEQYTLYKKCVQIVKETPDPRFTGDQMKFANRYEKERIMPKLSNVDRKLFVGAKSVIKYVNLKVMGEALGNVLGKARTALHVEMIKQINFADIMKAAEKKTVIFTSYVEVVKECDRVLRQAGMEPMLVYGDTNKNLASNVGAFEKDPDVNPLVATFPSLSTAVPLVMADQEIFLNVPFRDHELVQAKARIDRLGQDTPVKYVYVYLDTGKEPNISTRSKDILEWSREQVAQIMGVDYNGDAATTLDGYVASLESGQLPQVVRDFDYAMECLMERDGF